MANIPKVHRVKTEDLKAGTAVEQAEHPWASERTARHLARDHLQRNPKAYTGGGNGTTVELTLNQNVRVKPAQKKRKVVPMQQAPAWQTWGSQIL